MSRVPGADGRGRGGWTYVSLISTLPGLSLRPRRALALQFVAFEVAAVLLSTRYGRWDVLPFATVAVVVATAGSGLMVTLSDRLRSLDPPEPYRRTLFDAGVDVVMGLVAFIALVTYLLVASRGPDPGPVADSFGSAMPAIAVGFGLLVGWDLCYRIGTGWWASLTGLWRSVTFGPEFDRGARRAYVELDLLTIGFAGLQLLLVPFVLGDRLLAFALVGHIVVVAVVSGTSAVILARR